MTAPWHEPRANGSWLWACKVCLLTYSDKKYFSHPCVISRIYSTNVLSRESEAELLHSWKTHLYGTSRRAGEKKKNLIQCLPSQTSSWSEKSFPLIRKLCQTTFLSLTKELLSLGLLQFWQLCSAEPGCSSQPVTTLSRDTTLSFLNNKTKMNYAQASSNCG